MKCYRSTLKLSANITHWGNCDRILKKPRSPYSKVLSAIPTTTGFTCTELFLFVVKYGTPKDDELEELGREIAEKWEKLGRRLGVSDPKIQEIKRAHDQLSEKGYQMLKHWKQEKGFAATYQALCAALQHTHVQRQDLAEKFCYINGNYFLQLNVEAVV